MILLADNTNGVRYINKHVYKDHTREIHFNYIYVEPEDFHESLDSDVPVYTDIKDLKEIKRIYKDYNIGR